MEKLEIVIENVKEEKKYKGAYAKIFKILERDCTFTEWFEDDSSKGFVDGKYFLTVDGYPDYNQVEEIKKIKNVTVLN
jgi:hypothetical protein